MVYCGKPSKGCQMCRTRRIKCDLTKPTCNQCAKSRRDCPGYKDDFDLILRNETKATERRAQKAIRKAIVQKIGKAGQEPISPVSSRETLSPTTFGGGGSAKSPSEKATTTTMTIANTTTTTTGTATEMTAEMAEMAMTIAPSLQVSLESQASCHFIANFIMIPRHGSVRGFMDYLIPLLNNERAESPFYSAFMACALASLSSNRPGSRGGTNVSTQAFAQYTRAIGITGVALKDPKRSTSDGVLAAVLLLGFFENMAARQIGCYAWGPHVEGAVQIVKARGRKQLKSQIGLLMFIAVRTQLIVHSLSTGNSPIMGVDWWIKDAVNDSVATSCQRLNLQVGALRAEITQAMTNVSWSPDSVEMMLGFMHRSQVLEHEVVAWMRSTPEHWKFRTLCWEDHVPGGNYSQAEVFPGRIDVYNDFWIASVWNMARTTRLILASITVRCAAWICSPVDYRTTPEYATAARTCVDTITDIIASVPYHLGWHTKRKHLFRDPQLSNFACGEDDSSKGLAGYFLTWPLTCIMGQDYSTDAQRAWIRGRLKYIGDELGVRYAHMLTQLHVRIPSMLIRRDGLMAAPYPTVSNFENLLSARSAPPPAGHTLNPLQKREAMQQRSLEQARAELLAQAAGTAGQSGQWIARRWLAV